MNKQLKRTWLLIGGNLGDRIQNLSLARELLESSCGTIIKASSVYQTAAWGKTDQPAFLNQALELETTLNAEKLLQKLLGIEKKMGRVRNEKYGPRLIDIDILLYEDQVHHSRSLDIPHPELNNRRFALEPLAEIAPTLIHPVTKKSIAELLQNCSDPGSVIKF